SLLGACRRAEFIEGLKGKAAKALGDFAQMMDGLGEFLQAQPDEVIRQVLDRTGYRQMLKSSKDDEDADRLATIEGLITAARQFAEQDHSHTITDFLENVTLASDTDGWDQEQDCVSVMTMHAAKGLEFPVVYLVAVEQGLLPHERSLAKEDEIEEERRLAFVGMTRAKEELYLSHARLRDFRGNTLYAFPIMFLNELPPEAIESVALSASGSSALDAWRTGGAAARQGWTDAGIPGIPLPVPPRRRAEEGGYAEGMLVKHANYGTGRVIEVFG